MLFVYKNNWIKKYLTTWWCVMDDLQHGMDVDTGLRYGNPHRLRLQSDSDYPDRLIVKSNRVKYVMIALKHYAALTVAVKRYVSKLRRRVIGRLNRRLLTREWIQSLGPAPPAQIPSWEILNRWDARQTYATNWSRRRRRSPDTLPF